MWPAPRPTASRSTAAPADDPRGNLMTGFRYVDRFERRAGDWRIAKRVAVTEWSRIDDREQWWPIPDGMLTGRRDRTDAIYTILD